MAVEGPRERWLVLLAANQGRSFQTETNNHRCWDFASLHWRRVVMVSWCPVAGSSFYTILSFSTSLSLSFSLSLSLFVSLYVFSVSLFCSLSLLCLVLLSYFLSLLLSLCLSLLSLSLAAILSPLPTVSPTQGNKRPTSILHLSFAAALRPPPFFKPRCPVPPHNVITKPTKSDCPIISHAVATRVPIATLGGEMNRAL